MADRAFLHLQRSIVVDQTVRDNWKAAFGKGEVECEELGAVHLLQHGIWALKVAAEGERTDLVYQGPLADLSQADRVAEALVLTEWKVVKTAGALGEKIAQARE